MSEEYTPKLIDLRVAYRFMEADLMMDPNSKPHDPVLMAESDAEFDRLINEVRAEALREVASDLENASVSPIWCWDKCGDPMCRDDIRVDVATEIQSWIRDRADKYVEGLS